MASKIKETPIEEDISLDDLAKLTKLEETALHVAISSYHSELQSPDCEKQIEEMIKSIPDKDAFEILSMKNDKGNTPLHLAAAVGWLNQQTKGQEPDETLCRWEDGNAIFTLSYFRRIFQ
ncbi:uncharacterized protein LOC111381954 [Olea europaea subsp. europaea]|uniref:Uncharacterized protein LOC111381954, partial n=1 Tax=Olea europaea subsp. europaea TaxID=158383 RepID=A0A8S0SRD3_OLEEU|nr:uncharacterized protein LOC111381954 [Olea europaea subsp. europaea]